ncbi:hypothetical protein AB4371_10430 [Vibrio sp. 10N.261.51.A3]|uniref:hypothetical protein n=1 Tax=Vibrio sp. 10N.261.51.A3 TaxID=3229673 RepID=UPI003551676D
MIKVMNQNGVESRYSDIETARKNGVSESIITKCLHETKYNQAVKERQKVYSNESDPLRAEWQYELETGNPDAEQYKQKWLDKVAEIKERIPLPELVGQS